MFLWLRPLALSLLLFLPLQAQETGSPARLTFEKFIVIVSGSCSDYGSNQGWGNFSRELHVTAPEGNMAALAAAAIDCGHTRITFDEFTPAIQQAGLKPVILPSGQVQLKSVPLVAFNLRVAFWRQQTSGDGESMRQETANIFTSFGSEGGFCAQTDINAKSNINTAPVVHTWNSCGVNNPFDRGSTVLANSYASANLTAITSLNNGGSSSLSVSIVAVFNLLEDNEAPPDPFKPLQDTDSRFKAGQQTKCLRRSDGPHRIVIPIDRVVGDANADGTLASPEKLTENGILSTEAILSIPVFQRDFGGGSSPVKHKLSVNGTALDPAEIEGPAESWKLHQIRIPSKLLRFGTRRKGQTPLKADNEITLDIDSASPKELENACAAVDWAQLEFKAMAPLVLVHGNGQGDDGSGGKFWDGLVLGDKDKPRLQMSGAFTQELKDQFFPYDNSISMTSGPIVDHGADLGRKIPAIAREFGARHVHLVVHSKGGLDSREFLARAVPANFGVLSLTTLSTPHHGSSGPDYQMDSVGASVSDSDDKTRTYLGTQSPPNAGTPFLRVSAVEAFNSANVPLLPKSFKVDGEEAPVVYQSISADMNLDDSKTVFGNPTIQFSETAGLPGRDDRYETTWAYIIEQVYRLVGNVASTRAVVKERVHAKTGHVSRYKVVIETPTAQFEENDVAVQRLSSRLAPTFTEIGAIKANHSTIALPETAKIVLDSLRKVQPVKLEDPQ